MILMARRTITRKHRRLAQIMIDNDYESKGRAMVEAGYAEATARHPARAMRAKGYLMAVAEQAMNGLATFQKLQAEIDLRIIRGDLDQVEIGELISHSKTISEAFKNVSNALPKQQQKADGIEGLHVIDLG